MIEELVCQGKMIFRFAKFLFIEAAAINMQKDEESKA